MSLGLQVLKMHNGTASCKKRQRPCDSDHQMRNLKASRNEKLLATEECNNEQQPIARIFIDKRLIPPKVARLKSARIERPADPIPQRAVIKPAEEQYPPENEAPVETFPCLLCGVGFQSADRFGAHNCSVCHLNRIREASQRREEAFSTGRAEDAEYSSNLSGTDGEPTMWKALVNYCKMRGKQLDVHMRGGFTGTHKDVFLFEIDVCLDGRPFSGVGLSLDEAKRDVARRVFDSLVDPASRAGHLDDLAQEIAVCETDASIICLRRDLCVVLEQISANYDIRRREQFGLKVLDALSQIAINSDLLIGAMPVGSAFKGLFLPTGQDISFTLEMLVFCAGWPTYSLANRVLENLHERLPDVEFRGPQLDEGKAIAASDGRPFRVDVHFVASRRYQREAEVACDVVEDEREVCGECQEHTSCPDSPGARPLSKDSCLYAQGLLTAARRFKRRIAISQSAVAVFRILVHLCHIHHLLTTEGTAKSGQVTETSLESLIDYWLLIKADASMEWLFCRALHSLAYDGTMVEPELHSHLVGDSPFVFEKRRSDKFSVQSLAKHCIQLVMERRLIEAFNTAELDAFPMLSLTNPA